MASIRVAVRVRPLDKREKQLKSRAIIHVKGNATSILDIKLSPNGIRGDGLKERRKTFSYDFSYDSTDKRSSSFASQEKIFLDLGSDVLKAAFEGFNACVFSYGQTGTGKSYTMMGHTGDQGLIPRICEGLFGEISQRNQRDAVSFRTEIRTRASFVLIALTDEVKSNYVSQESLGFFKAKCITQSYLEIYNERVQDLLKNRTTPADGGGLRVREHPRDGPYVENLSKHRVHNYSDVEGLMNSGNVNRSTACTSMNDVSSRSHAIFTIRFTQAWFDAELPCETLSKIHLVDLAGSERAVATRTTGTRLKEGANINKSLVTLGIVISALAENSEGGQATRKKKPIFIPYRDSVLTWLLKDSLGGNSKTIMIATISPAAVNYGETLSTLRYASRAKNIMNSPTVNEDGSVRVIRELQAEIARLRGLVEQVSQVPHGDLPCFLKVEERLHQNEAKVLALTKEWTNKWTETQNILKEETLALRKEGSGVVLDSQLPHLIGIDEDLLSTGIILYHLKEGPTLIGSGEASCQDIVLRGPALLSEHCVLENCAGTVSLIPQRGALCSVNGTTVTHPCQLTQGAVIQLGKETILRFNHPEEAAQLREKRKSGMLFAFSLSMTDLSKSTENLSKAMLLNSRRLVEKPSQQEVEWQHHQDRLHIKRLQNEPSEAADQQRGEDETKGREMEETDSGQMEMAAVTADSRLQSSSVLSASPERCMTVAIPWKCPVSHSSCELDGDALQGGISTRDGREQERGSTHKSGPGLISKKLWREAETGAGIESFGGGGVWSGDASLQQTSVLGLGDGCGMGPEGNANKSQGIVADCCKGSPDSGGNSLGSMSHLQRTGGTSSKSVNPRTSTPSKLFKKTYSSHGGPALEDQFSCGAMDEKSFEEIPGECEKKTAAAAEQKSGLGSLVSRVSWMVQEAGRLLWNSPKVLQQVREEGLQLVGARWSSQVISLVRESQVLSVVKDSQVFSLVKESHVFSLVKDSFVFSLVKDLPLMQHIQMELTQGFQPDEAGRMIQRLTCSNTSSTLPPTQSCAKLIELPDDQPLGQEENWSSDESITEDHDQFVADIHFKQEQSMIKELIPVQQSSEPQAYYTRVDKDPQNSATVQKTDSVKIFCQKLVDFPDALVRLQSLPLRGLVDALQSVISTSVFTSQRTVGLYWLSVAKCSQPQPCAALMILMESGLYTLTSDPRSLVLFHHLPLLQLKEIQVGLAGQSLRLRGTTEESILGLYTHSQKMTQELCRAILGVICPGDSRASQHPLLHGDLTMMSLDWQAYTPDLLLHAGLRVCCHSQKSLADLVYLLHGNMDHERPSMGEVRLLLYTSVGVCISPSTCSELLAQLLLTDTHLGLVQEDMVFHPAPHSVPLEPRRTKFHSLTLRHRSDIRCVLVHDEDRSGATRMDIILAHVGARGHPERLTEAAIPPAHAANSSPHVEVWKLTFSCSNEAGCLINHLSSV